MVKNRIYMRVPGGAWIDSYERYGITLEETSMSKLMTPAPNKEAVENKSDLQHGKRIIRDSSAVKKDERNVSLILNMSASSKESFLTRYGMFCTEILDNGYIDIRVSYLSDVIYRMTYLDCTQFMEFEMGIGKYTLSLNEPDPTNRGAVDKWDSE